VCDYSILIRQLLQLLDLTLAESFLDNRNSMVKDHDGDYQIQFVDGHTYYVRGI
jgi:hypothetical protein